MSSISLLNFQYNLSKKLTRPTKWLSSKDRELSGLSTVSQTSFLPNSDEMRRVFEKIDRDKDGKISPRDLHWLMTAFKPHDNARNLAMKAEAKAMVEAMSQDGGGHLSFNDFMEVHKKGVRVVEMQRAFRVFDQDGDGRIGADELMVVMRMLGEECGLEDCTRMVRNVDRSGDGLDMDDFLAMMTSTMKMASY